MAILNERIKACRKACHLSADEVAAALGVSIATVYRYESAEIANMGVDKIKPLAQVLHTTVAYLMGWTDNPDTQARPAGETGRGQNMSIEDSNPFKTRLAACEKRYGKGNFGVPDNASPPISAKTVEAHAQAIYNELTGCGLTYTHTVLIMEIVQEQLRIEHDRKTL